MMERSAQSGQVGQTGGGLPLAFELLAEIATGPTARVELCRIRAPKDVAGRLAAVKRLHPHIAEDPQFYSMFVDEVWMTAALDHKNITRVVGWGTDAEGTYLAVELVEGVSLARLMKTVFETREAFTERMVVYLGNELCAGLSAAHALRSPHGELLNLVHRDLTPGNILVGFDGRVLIADFGLAKAKQRVTKTLTGLLKGHPQYMAPEQASESPIDARADLFSLGVVLFELFTGKPPWTGATELETFRMMATEPPADIAALRPKLDRELVNVVNRLLAKNPAERFSNANEVRDRLAYWLDAHGYKDDNADAVARFVRRNAMRQMRWFERAVAGDFVAEATRAKSRLLGARARSQQAPPSRTPKSQPPPVAAAVKSSRRRAAARRASEDATDVGAWAPEEGRLEERPSNDSGEWSEEVPTVVKPNAHHPVFRRGGGPGALDVSAELPSFSDDDGDNRTTSVKPQVMLGMYAQATRAQPPRIAEQAAPYGKTGTLDLRSIESADSDSSELPTTPQRGGVIHNLDTWDRSEPIESIERGAPASNAPSGPLRKLPPPPPREVDRTRPTPDAPVGGAGRISALPAPPVPQAPDTIPNEVAADARQTGGARPGTHGTRRLPRTEADFIAEAERFAQAAAQRRAEADVAAKVAAHRAVLAQLAAEAAQFTSEAVRVVATHGAPHGITLLEEAYRLEASIARGDAQAEAISADGSGVEAFSRSSSVPPPPPGAHLHPGRDGARHEPVAGVPFHAMQGLGGAAHTPQGPGVSGHFSASSGTDARKEPTAPSRYLSGGAPNDMFAGEVFGVRVPFALAAALLIAVAMVVLVWIIVS
ncbi:MAG: serine/threonine protein kinase [Polyangiaceae bacterium]|nr:serine/threonine protein kinase [Polyangiaceae bacterium]